MTSENKMEIIDPKMELNEPSDVAKLEEQSTPLDGPQDDDEKFHSFSESLDEEKEPLFVIDRTHNFRMSQAIQYDYHNSTTKNSTPRDDAGLRQNSCWNCGLTDHSLYNCPEPRNQRIINLNRHSFLMQKQSQQQQFDNWGNRINRFTNRKNNRYFLQSSNSQYDKFTPGKLSSTLLKALDLPENGIPLHIYKMREIGYPKAWLEEAKEEYSGISIFTEPNKCLPFPGMKNGENDSFYNINEKKLHEYPGYNIPSHPDAVDECKLYGCPEFNPEQSLKHMYEKLKAGKSLTECSGYSSSEDTGFVSNNGALAGEENLLSKVTVGDKSSDRPPSSPEDGEITDDESMDENKLETLSNEIVPEQEVVSEQGIIPEQIMEEHNNSDAFHSVIENNDSINDSQLTLSKSIDSESESTTKSAPLKRKFSEIKSEVLGTPVLKQFSPYSNRPTHEHFAKGMVDLVDHENLPNSIGTFAKLKEILKDVRSTLNNLL